ncbi:MAG: hypothetical protein BWY57_00959 [Betaproteobacteria bacterium ADurb.Bin341]|nr:MAG: hypothetical protein BWY57_00959 [Betaproteobacteria bacterium ADurb.Bin341]
MTSPNLTTSALPSPSPTRGEGNIVLWRQAIGTFPPPPLPGKGVITVQPRCGFHVLTRCLLGAALRRQHHG